MRKLFLLVPVLLLAGCRGEQVAFQFRPASATSVPVAVAPAVANAPAMAASAALATESPAVSPPTTPRKPAKQLRPRRLAVALNALPQSTLATLAVPRRTSQHLAQHIGRRHATADLGNSLKAIYFMYGALILLSVGLVLLARLANIIFGFGFFTALGYLSVVPVLFILLLYVPAAIEEIRHDRTGSYGK